MVFQIDYFFYQKGIKCTEMLLQTLMNKGA